MTINSRISDIHHWLEGTLSSLDFTIETASSDASFRRYFRIIQNQQTWILMDAPPEHEDVKPFIKLAAFLKNNGVNAPEIIAHNTQQGFLLLTDFGNTAYLSELNNESVNELYGKAMRSLLKIQLCPTDLIDLPVYDQTLLQSEMDLFPQWFLKKHLEIEPPEFLTSIYSLLTESALSQPQVLVHRDYHSRNLMQTTIDSPGIIDFQDAVIGPVTYDLVSLLRDCYIAWPEQKSNEWLNEYLNLIKQHNLLKDIEFEQFKKWFDLMGLQRHLKVLGIFCRLNYRDGKNNYLNDLPLTLRYVIDVASGYGDFDELVTFLNQQPKIQAML